MALNIATSFPGKSVAPSAAYPFGSAQNVTAPGAGDGTPLVADIYNDLFGFQQGLLDAAGLTASGDPDTALVSQYLDAIKIILQDSHDRLNPLTLEDWQNDTSAQAGDVVTPVERTANNGGGALGNVISGTGDADDAGIVAHNTLDLSWVLPNRYIIIPAEFGFISGGTDAQNTVVFEGMRDFVIRNGNNPVIYNLPGGLLQLRTPRWLHGINNVIVNGNNTGVQNTLLESEVIGASTNSRVPLFINQDFFYDDVFSVDNGVGTLNVGLKIVTVAQGSDQVTVTETNTISVGDRVLIYGWNQSSAGYPISARRFEHHRVKAISGNDITLNFPLAYDYDSRWHDIDNNNEGVSGAARILSLDREEITDGFTLADRIELNDIEMLPSPYFPGGGVPDSLGGSLYVYGIKRFIGNNLTVNAFFFPSESEYIEVNESSFAFTEIDKVLSNFVSNKSVFREVSNGPACLNAEFNESTFLEPIANWSVKRTLFKRCHHKQQDEGFTQLVRAGISTTVEEIIFDHPYMYTSPNNKDVPLLTADSTVSVTVISTISGGIIVAFTGVADATLRAVGPGSILKNATTSIFVKNVYASGGDTAIEGDITGVAPSSSDVFICNITQSIEIHRPTITKGIGAFTGALGSSQSLLDVTDNLKADVVSFEGMYRESSKLIRLPFIDVFGRTGNTLLNMEIAGHIRSIIVSITTITAVGGAKLFIGRPSGEGAKPFEEAIDLTTLGVRHASLYALDGSVGTDSLTLITGDYHQRLGLSSPTDVTASPPDGFIIIELV